jgi:protein TonB
MEPNKILRSHLLDIIFDDRNKTYGAYELRVTYPERIKRSMLITLGVGVIIFTGVAWTAAGKTKPGKEPEPHVIARPIALIDEIAPPLPPPPRRQTPPPVQVQTERFVVPVVADDDVVKDQPIAVKDLGDSKIGFEKSTGIEDPGDIMIDPNDGIGKGIVQQKDTDDPNYIFIKVEKEAEYEGDWAKFLRGNLRPEAAQEKDVPNGSYTVWIQFVVDADGSISRIEALTNHGYGLEEEAIRVVKKSKKWLPAVQNGRKVKAYRKQPITFVIEE